MVDYNSPIMSLGVVKHMTLGVIAALCSNLFNESLMASILKAVLDESDPGR